MDVIEVVRILMNDIRCVERNTTNKQKCLRLLSEIHNFLIQGDKIRNIIGNSLWVPIENEIVFVELAVLIDHYERIFVHTKIIKQILRKNIVGHYVLKRRIANPLTDKDDLGVLYTLPNNCLMEICKYL
jgi:hypothetical protein